MNAISKLLAELVALDLLKESLENSRKNHKSPQRYYLLDRLIGEDHYLWYEYRTGMFVPSLALDHTREFQSEFTNDRLARIGLPLDNIRKVNV